MVYLIGNASTPAIRALLRERRGFGRMVQPAGRGARGLLGECVWAADNGCFAQGDRFDLDAYLAWLGRYADYTATCLFASAPDVVGEAAATWERSAPVLPQIRALGFPVALVAQDGWDGQAVDWSAFDCLFLGGTDRFKRGPEGAGAARDAKHHGKWLHVGRINTRPGILLATKLGADSADGTTVGIAPDENLPKVRRWLGEANNQLQLAI